MKNLAKLVMILTVCIVIIGGTLAPYVDNVSAETKTYTNEGMPYAAVDDDTHTIVVTDSSIEVDGEEIDQSLFPDYTSLSIVYADAGFIRLITNSVVVNVTFSGSTKSFSYSGYTVTITIVGDAATITTTEGSSTATVSDVNYYVATAGDYVLSENPYVNGESVIYGAGSTSFSTPNTVIYTVWSGTIEEISAEVLRTTNGSSVVSSTEVNTTNDTSNLYRVDSVLVNYTATYSGTDYSTTSTYTYFLAPAEVVYDNPDYLGSTNAVILLAIVVITIAALLAVTARYLVRDY